MCVCVCVCVCAREIVWWIISVSFSFSFHLFLSLFLSFSLSHALSLSLSLSLSHTYTHTLSRVLRAHTHTRTHKFSLSLSLFLSLSRPTIHTPLLHVPGDNFSILRYAASLHSKSCGQQIFENFYKGLAFRGLIRVFRKSRPTAILHRSILIQLTCENFYAGHDAARLGS